MSRRLTAAIALVAAAAGCGSGGDGPGATATATTTTSGRPAAATTTTAATPDATVAGDGWLVPTRGDVAGRTAYPPLLVASGPDVHRVAGGERELVGAVDGVAGVAVGDARGTVVAEQRGTPTGPGVSIVRLDDDGATPVPLGDAAQVVLYDLVPGSPQPRLLVGVLRSGEGREPSGDVLVTDLDGGDPTRVTEGFAAEFGVHHASAASGVVVTSAFSDLTESFGFHHLDGTPATGWHDPTDDLPYNEPPLLTDAVLSPDARELAYLSGPDTAGATMERTGRWELVVTARDGTERLRLAVAGADVEVDHLDFDGRWAVLSSSVDGDRRPPLVLDTDDPRAPGIVVDAVRGVATFEHPAPGDGEGAGYGKSPRAAMASATRSTARA